MLSVKCNGWCLLFGVRNCTASHTTKGHTVAQLVQALRYESEGHGSDSWWCHRIFHWHNPFSCTVALGLNQPLTEMSTRNISWGVTVAGAEGWQPYHLHVPIVLKSGSLNLLEPSGHVQACNGIAVPLHITKVRLMKVLKTFYQLISCTEVTYILAIFQHSQLHSMHVLQQSTDAPFPH